MLFKMLKHDFPNYFLAQYMTIFTFFVRNICQPEKYHKVVILYYQMKKCYIEFRENLTTSLG